MVISGARAGAGASSGGGGGVPFICPPLPPVGGLPPPPPPPPVGNKDDAIVQAKTPGQKASQKVVGSNHCVWCIRPRAMMVCAGCETARYCNERCQKAHWPEHRKECVRPPKKVPAPPEPAPAG
mmetsp:Transcript_104832/g.278906  ORF Transcript_104832/g.278906 Transcript_104832/m.278906 type:complete len:124 (-) Transcript_104832:5-376(-)